MSVFRKPGKRMFLDWRGYPVAILVVVLATLLKYWGQPDIIATPNSLPYMLVIVIIAIYFGLGPAFLASLLSLFAYDFYFVAPFNSVTVPRVVDYPTLIIFVIVSIIVSFLASNLRQQIEEARTLTGKLIKSQEEEKRRIARELHDDTSPTLSYLGLELDALTDRHSGLSEEVIQRLRTVRENIDIVQKDIRHFSYELHSTILDNLGLEPALESLVDELNSKGKIQARFEVAGTARSLPDEVNLTLYRIAQEALNNVWKHSRATEAAVDLQYAAGKAILSIADNGVGFSPAAQNKSSLGLTSMRERCSLIGARLKIDSATGRGTTIQVEVQA